MKALAMLKAGPSRVRDRGLSPPSAAPVTRVDSIQNGGRLLNDRNRLRLARFQMLAIATMCVCIGGFPVAGAISPNCDSVVK